MASRKIEVEILGDASSLERAFGKSSKSASSFGSKLGGIAKGAALAGGAAGLGLLTVGLEKSVKAGIDAEASQARLAQAFKNVHVAIKPLQGSIEKTESASRKLGFTDGDVRDALGSLITATGNYHKSVKDLGVAEDLARFKHIGLTDASKMLTMAMTGSQRAAKQLGITVIPVTANMDALKRAHVDLTTAAGKTAEAHAKLADKMATGQAVIQAVTDKVHGQAKAYADTVAGGMAQFKAQLDHIEEAIGKKLLPVITRAIDTVVQNWPKISATLVAAWAIIKPPLVELGGLLKRIADIVVQNWPTIKPVVLSVAKVVGDAMKIVATAIRLITDLLSGKWAKAWADAKALVVGIVNGIKDFFLAEVAPFRAALSAIGTAALNGLKAGFGDAVGWVKGRVNAIVGFFAELPVGIGKAVAAGAAEGKKLLLSAIGKVFSVLPGFVRDALGIHSPSRVFADIGHNIIMGAVHGIEKAGPKLLSAAKDKFSKLAHIQTGSPAGIGVSTGGLVPQVERALFYARNMGWHGVVTSGWRSYAEQAALYARYLAGGPLAAPPGRSSHETGQAVDVTDYGTFGRIMSSAPAFERLYNRLGGLDPVHFSVSGFAKGGIVTKPTLAMIGEAGQNEAVIPLGDSGVDISELGAQRIADAADRTTWARSPEVHVEELAQVLNGLALPIQVMTLSDVAVGEMTGAVQGAADAIGAAVSSAIGPYLGGGGGDGGGGDGGGDSGSSGGGLPSIGLVPLPDPSGRPGPGGRINPGPVIAFGGGGPTRQSLAARPATSGPQTVVLQLDGKTIATAVRGADSQYRQVNGG